MVELPPLLLLLLLPPPLVLHFTATPLFLQPAPLLRFALASSWGAPR